MSIFIFSDFFFAKKKTKTKWVWRISKLSPNSLRTQKRICVHKLFCLFYGLAARIFFLKKNCTRIFFLKKNCARIFFWVWREFGDSPNSFCCRIFFEKNIIKKNENWHQAIISLWVWSEFGDSPNSLQTRPKLTGTCLLNVNFLFFWFFLFFSKKNRKQNEFGESPNSLQTQKKICVHNFFWPFLDRLHAYFSWKKSCARIFFLSLERVWRFSKLILFFVFFFAKKWNLKENSKNWHQANMSLWVWAEFGESLENLQTHSTLTGKCLFDVNFHFFWLFVCKKKRKQNEFGKSPKSLQTLSKLKKEYECTNFFCLFYGLAARICFLKKICTHIFLSLERVWRFSKLILFSFFCNKENPKIIDRVWREYGESPNSLQAHREVFVWCQFSFFLTIC